MFLKQKKIFKLSQSSVYTQMLDNSKTYVTFHTSR